MIPLKIVRAEPAAHGIQLFELRDPAGAVLPEFSAGAHLTLRTPGGLLRKYSLCNDPAERDRYVIAVKRDASGRGGSMDLVDHVHAGNTAVTPPSLHVITRSSSCASHHMQRKSPNVPRMKSCVHVLPPSFVWNIESLLTTTT